MYRIGIDLGGTNIAVGIVDENYNIVLKGSVPTLAQREINCVIDDMAALCKKCEEGKLAEAAKLQLSLLPLMEALFLEVNPIPVKTALAKMGLCTEEMRLPLCKMREQSARHLFSVMGDMGLI